MTEPVLVLAWLVFAHLVADFVLQNDWIAINKGTGGREGWSALGLHGFHVALCLAPVVLAYGGPGLAFLLIVVVSHMVVDRWKVQATRRAEASAQATARRRAGTEGAATPGSGLGAAWTPLPGALFLADQALHMTFTVVGWLVVLEAAPLLPQFVDFADQVLRSWDRALVHQAILTTVVIVSLLIVNTRGAYYFILALVSPREVAPDPAVAAPAATPAPSGYTLRVGPLVATVEPGVAAPAADPPHAAPMADAVPSVPSSAPARIGATIGVLERLLVVAFMLTGATAAVGFVIAAKTIARFKQLDDRGFAEYYLLGTLASMGVAIGSALLAAAALSTLG